MRKNSSRLPKKSDVPRVGPVLTVGADCLLTGGSSDLEEKIRAELTIENPKYQAAQKYGRWVGKSLKRQLYFYEEEPDGLVFPRGFGARVLELCEKYMGCRPVIVDLRRELSEVDYEFTGRLRPYQEAAVADILKRHFGVLVAGTGSGKTVMALAVIVARRQPTLIIVHSKELMYQWRDRIDQFLGIKAGLIGDGKYDIQSVSVAIVNSARKHLDELPSHFGQLIVDECHRVPASLFTEVVRGFDCRYSLGLSATAYRREDDLTPLIYLYMGNRAHQIDSRQLEESGAILKPEFIQKPTAFKYGFRGDYQALIKALTGNEARNRLIVADVVSEAQKETGTILVVSDRVAHCETLAAMLAEEGVEARILTGRLSAEERSSLVDLVRRGEIRVLVSTLQLVGEGFDAADLTVLFLTTPIKFTGRLRQVIGRILRPAAGKQPRVIDYVDQQVGVLRSSARIRLETYQDIA